MYSLDVLMTGWRGTYDFKKTEERISIYNIEDDRIEDDETYEDFYAFLNDTYDMLGIGD